MKPRPRHREQLTYIANIAIEKTTTIFMILITTFIALMMLGAIMRNSLNINNIHPLCTPPAQLTLKEKIINAVMSLTPIIGVAQVETSGFMTGMCQGLKLFSSPNMILNYIVAILVGSSILLFHSFLISFTALTICLLTRNREIRNEVAHSMRQFMKILLSIFPLAVIIVVLLFWS